MLWTRVRGLPRLGPRDAALGEAPPRAAARSWALEEALADLAGLSGNYVGDAERGERNIGLRAIWQLADALNVPASELFSEAERRGASKRAKS